MSLWSVTRSKRWSHDVSLAQDDDEKSSRLPPPVLQPTISNRRVSSVQTFWRRIQHRVRSRSARSMATNEHPMPSSQDSHAAEEETKVDDAEIDEIVVDRSWAKEYSTSSPSSIAEDYSDTCDDDFEQRYNPTTRADRTGFWACCKPFAILRWTVWPGFKNFLDSRFPDPKLELEYQRELWDEMKSLAEVAALFFLVNWIMAVLSIPTPTVIADKVFYYGICPVLTAPILVFCHYNFPMKYRRFYQTFICISTWIWAFYQILYVYMCGYYSSELHIFTCGSKDFLSTFYYASAMQTVALFGADLRRVPAMIGAIAFLIFSSVLIIPHRASWYRNIINFLAFQGFLLYMHFRRENSSRKLHLARIHLKLQIEKTTRAQMNERKAADSKYRLTSYVFHEVRVPLNTAILAVQNMDASGVMHKSMLLEFHALEGSLSQMSKVLNDVLDFNRMDSGKLEVLMRPYSFHQVLRSMFMTLELATSARELEFESDLDPKIDDYVRRAHYKALGESDDNIEKLMKEPNSDGFVSGDENRLRQIVTNLAGNACKFTPKGGKLKISTRLIMPDLCDGSEAETKVSDSVAKASGEPKKSTPSLTSKELDWHNAKHGLFEEAEKIVVRIEVTDTGLGIAPQDLANANIFSAFIQTEQGRTQGGKGTGLGLALVRRIVKLSGGRLGVRSKVGRGSTFWVELPLGVGSKALHPQCDVHSDATNAPSFLNMYPLASTKTLDESVTSHRHNDSIDQADIASQRASQTSPGSTRSAAALHGLMNQGGSVELSLAKYSTNSPVPTRTLGDPSTGTDIPVNFEDSINPLLMDTRENSSETIMLRQRPTYIPLPSPQSFTLDAHPPPTGEPPSPSIRRTSITTSALFDQWQVLVVDDDSMTRRLMARMLERLGCSVTTAANGEIALDILLGTSTSRTPGSDRSDPVLEDLPTSTASPRAFTVVFLDNQMPVMSGLKVVMHLREIGRTDFVVGVTGNALITDQREYLDAGADHVLTKPVMERSLTSMLVEADQRRKATRAES